MIGVAYGYYVKHGGIGRYLANVFENLDNPENVALLALEKTLPLPFKMQFEKIRCVRDTRFLNIDENLDFSEGVIKRAPKFKAIHSHGIYDFSPEIYTAHICFDKYARRIKTFLGKKYITPELKKMCELEKKMICSEGILI
jgi:hypothetical protein